MAVVPHSMYSGLRRTTPLPASCGRPAVPAARLSISTSLRPTRHTTAAAAMKQAQDAGQTPRTKSLSSVPAALLALAWSPMEYAMRPQPAAAQDKIAEQLNRQAADSAAAPPPLPSIPTRPPQLLPELPKLPDIPEVQPQWLGGLLQRFESYSSWVSYGAAVGVIVAILVEAVPMISLSKRLTLRQSLMFSSGTAGEPTCRGVGALSLCGWMGVWGGKQRSRPPALPDNKVSHVLMA